MNDQEVKNFYYNNLGKSKFNFAQAKFEYIKALRQKIDNIEKFIKEIEETEPGERNESRTRKQTKEDKERI